MAHPVAGLQLLQPVGAVRQLLLQPGQLQPQGPLVPLLGGQPRLSVPRCSPQLPGPRPAPPGPPTMPSPPQSRLSRRGAYQNAAVYVPSLGRV